MNAQALVDIGAGLRLLPEEITPSAVVDAVQALIDHPAYRESARAIAAEIAAMPEPVETVPTLERLASR
jgi:calicheamicin 3'-O-methyl-rhamnosyltransferase